MKRIGNLYHKIYDISNLNLADQKARKGKSWQKAIAEHDAHRDENIEKLRQMLLNHAFRTSAYQTFVIYELKKRVISRLPYYPDRIVHHAIMNVIEPILVEYFTADTYSSLKDRGIHAAARRIRKALRDDKQTQYCLKLDIQQFYPSIDHDILKSVLKRKFKDDDLLSLLFEIIDSSPGLPIGNYLSQYFANLYLTGLDRFIKNDLHIKYYFRYCDDLVLLAADKAALHETLAKIQKFLQEQLKLAIKPNFQIFPVDKRGIDFVGYRFYHSHTLLRKSIKQNFARMLAKRPSQQSAAAYWGWAKHCNSRHLLNKLFKTQIS